MPPKVLIALVVAARSEDAASAPPLQPIPEVDWPASEYDNLKQGAKSDRILDLYFAVPVCGELQEMFKAVVQSAASQWRWHPASAPTLPPFPLPMPKASEQEPFMHSRNFRPPLKDTSYSELQLHTPGWDQQQLPELLRMPKREQQKCLLGRPMLSLLLLILLYDYY